MARPNESTERKVVKVMTLNQVVGPRILKPKIHPCTWPGCAKAFNRKPDMARHVRGFHEKKKDYHCTFPGCGKSFGQAATLSTHENTHTGDKPYQCCYCRRTFGDQSSCSRHQREQHVGMKYFCPFCKSENKRNTEFYKHLLVQHRIEKDEFDIEPYKLPSHLETEDLAVLPQFNLPGMLGIGARRNAPRQQRRSGRVVNSSMHSSVGANAFTQSGLIALTRASSADSFTTTPSLSNASISPSPSLLDVSYEGIPVESSRYDYGSTVNGNYLGVDFTGGSTRGVPPAHVPAQPVSRALSPANISYSPEPAYAMQHNQFAHAHGLDRSCDLSYMEDIGPQLFGASAYEGYDLSGMTPALDLTFQGGWQPYMPPISQMARSSHGQASAWGQGL